MPYLTLKHSCNIVEQEFDQFFLEAHELLAKFLPTKVDSCRSLVIPSIMDPVNQTV